MPTVVFYRETDRDVPLLEWLERLPEKARLACLARIKLLKEFGHGLRRPNSDYLRDGIHELRAKAGGVNYRILYFFHGQEVVVASHGIVKQQAATPPIEIERARRRKRIFETDPQAHTYRED